MPIWQKLELQEHPPVECAFAVGDRVIYTNDAGLKFDCDIIGFSENTDFYGRFIHLKEHGKTETGSCWWFPHLPTEITKAA